MDAPAAARPTIEQFCGKVCSFVRFSPDHAAISAELTGHMEEHRDALLEACPNMTLRDAESRAVRAMGDPEELGRWLDQIHNPRLGWFQIWFRRVVWTLAVLILLFALPQAKETVTNLTAPPSYDGVGMGYLLEHYDEYDVVADFTPSRGEQMLYQLPTSAGDSSGNPSAVYPFASYYDLWVGGIHPEATSITLHFDRFGENAISLTLPLKGGA